MKIKKWELLKYAYDNYPKGTKFIEAGGEEFVSSGCFNIVYGNILKDNYGLVYDEDNDKWAEIIVSEKPMSILDGKVVIQVNNEREFELLMQHFESKGWILNNGIKPTNQEFSSKCWASYKNRSDFKYVEEYLDITVIPFSDFAKEVGIEVPKFIMKSEDGVDLYEWDVIHVSDLVKNDNRYDYLGEYKLEKKDFDYTKQKSPEWYVFHSKENALKWVEEQNKPKEIEVPLYFMNQTATVTANCEVHINGTRGITYAKLSHGDIADIQNAINKLK